MLDELDLFAIEACFYLPYVYWVKMMRAHLEFTEDLLV